MSFNRIRDNDKNTNMAQSSSSSQSEAEDDEEIFNIDDDLDFLIRERLSEERFMNETLASDKPRKRQRETVSPEIRTKFLMPSKIERSPLNKVETLTRLPNNQMQTNCNHNWWKCLTFVVVLLIVVALTNGCLNTTIFFSPKENISSNNLVNSVLENVKATLLNLKSKYKNQDKDLWHNAYNGISDIIKRPHQPSILLLLGEKSDPLDCLATLLSNVSSNALNSGRLMLTPNEFDHDTGSVIEEMRKKIKTHKAVVIWDLLNINVEALKAFHNLCDRINPLVEEVIYIITVVADNFDKERNPTKFLEDELTKKLKGKMKSDAIQPLITRITDGHVSIVKPEPTVTDCPLPKASKN
ncbi:uncharacterized protein LOC106637555 isoform X2 [Copidosoma floridanum]|nr:uncharacterized protein LOC106637555 isoform X2 [Copidosoma floridanum]XP_023245267.1 uncharacterized protein LOC106637555 isoform X2 [Copidosoma floridanum]